MRLGILSDIHGNIGALESAWATLSSASCDKIVCAGDVVGYGARPAECIDFLRSHKIDTVRGNHDHYVAFPAKTYEIQQYALEAIRWTRGVLSQDHLDWLGNLPFRLDLPETTIVHASLEAHDGVYWPYILDSKTAMFHFYLQEARYAFFGHTHIPLLFTFDGRVRIDIEILRSRRLDGPPGMKYLLNPGSVGQPRDFDCRSSFVIFDTVSGEVRLLRSSYDVTAAQEQILAAGLPPILAARLSRGN